MRRTRKPATPHATTNARSRDPEARSAALAAALDSARRKLALDTLEARGQDALDFHEIAVWTLREVLTDMFAAGLVTAGHTAKGGPAPEGELTITQITSRRGPGHWVQGTVAGHTFEALVFRGHAAHPSFELGTSRISKLQILDAAGREVVNFDRGWDVAPKTEDAQRVTDLLAIELTMRVYGK